MRKQKLIHGFDEVCKLNANRNPGMMISDSEPAIVAALENCKKLHIASVLGTSSGILERILIL